jgi:hypothetical protein
LGDDETTNQQLRAAILKEYGWHRGGGSDAADRRDHRRKLQWNPEKETFVGDDEANRWQSREMRQPSDCSAVGGA